MRDTWRVNVPLTDEQRSELLSEHPDWKPVGEGLSRTWRFGDFAEAIGFVNRVALAAQARDHHPDIDIRWNRVTLTMITHSAGGLTGRDRDLIAEIDGWG